jgi:hypothetical protein
MIMKMKFKDWFKFTCTFDFKWFWKLILKIKNWFFELLNASSSLWYLTSHLPLHITWGIHWPMDVNKIQWAKNLILNKDYMFFCPKVIFHSNEFFSEIHSKLLQKIFNIVPIHYNFCCLSFLNKCQFLKMCKFLVDVVLHL